MIPPMNNTCPGETAQSRTVAKLKHRLRSGQFTNVMPGERELSKALAAGRGTIRKALAQLQEEGFLAAPDKNRARKIIRTSTSPVQSLPLLEKRVCFLSSVPIRDIPQSIWVELYQLEKALRIEGMALQLVEATWAEKNNPDMRLEKLETEYPGCCWILYRATEEIQLWFKRKGLPCLVRGVSYPSSNLPYLDTHWEVLASHAAGYLYQKGHRRIALCIPDSKLLPGGTLDPLCHPHAVGCHQGSPGTQPDLSGEYGYHRLNFHPKQNADIYHLLGGRHG